MLSRDFKEFAELLNAGGVEYLVVGGYALAAHGHPRYTGDFDVWLRLTPTNLARVITALEQFGFGGLGLQAADLQVPDAVVQLGYPPGRIDLMTGIDGVEFEACWQRRVEVDVGGTRLPIIGVEDFKANKRATGRLKDLADIEALEDGPPDAAR